MEHGAWEGRALRNDPVGHFSEGACMQGRHGARSRAHARSNATGPAKRESMENGAENMKI
jgi:hypothetical protein